MEHYSIEELENLIEEYLLNGSNHQDEYYMTEYELLECGSRGFISWLKDKEQREVNEQSN